MCFCSTLSSDQPCVHVRLLKKPCARRPGRALVCGRLLRETVRLQKPNSSLLKRQIPESSTFLPFAKWLAKWSKCSWRNGRPGLVWMR